MGCDWIGRGLIGVWVHWAGRAQRRMEVGRAGFRWLIEAGEFEVGGCMGDARARGGRICTTGEHCAVCLGAPASVVRALCTPKLKKSRFKVNPDLRDVVKNQNQRMAPKVHMYFNHAHK